MAVGLKEIAQQAGVSAVTVSAALNGTGRVSDKKRREIMRIAERLKYQPNTLARILKSKHNDAVGLIINATPEEIPGSGVMSELIMQFIKESESQNCKYHIEFVDSDSGKDELPDIIASGFVGGVICAGYINEGQTRFKNWLGTHQDFPFVKFEEPYDYCLRSDLVSGMLMGLKYLKQHGHRKVALHVGPRQYDFHSLVYRGYIQGLDVLSMKSCDDWIYNHIAGKEDMESKFQWVKKIVSGSDAPTAIICAGMGAARNVISNMYQLGKKVPDDLSVIGIGASWEAVALYPFVTSIERDIAGMVEKAVDILKKRMKGESPVSTETWVNPKLVVRDTVIAV